MKKLLLTACCGPCATTALARLCPEYDVTVHFTGDNLDSVQEYERRLVALSAANAALNYGKAIIVEAYQPAEFYAVAKSHANEPEGGKRCTECFRRRLQHAANYAKTNGFDAFATTLTVSPHKNAAIINEIGEQLAQEFGVDYLPTDLKKNDGFGFNTRESKRLGLYRQNYCGCKYSKKKKQI